MKIKCELDSDNKSYVKLSVIDNNNHDILILNCHQANLCEQLPNLVKEIEQYITQKQISQNIKDVEINIDNAINITTKRILISFFNGFCTINDKNLCFNICYF